MNAMPLVVPRPDEQHQTRLAKRLIGTTANDEINIDKLYKKFLKLKRTTYPGPNDPVKVTDLLEELSFDDRWEILEKYKLSQLIFSNSDNTTKEIFKHSENVSFVDDDQKAKVMHIFTFKLRYIIDRYIRYIIIGQRCFSYLGHHENKTQKCNLMNQKINLNVIVTL